MIRNSVQSVLLSAALVASAAAAEIPRPEHPRPDAMRAHWANLNGDWQFGFDPGDLGRKQEWFLPNAPQFDKTITVPFGWESELSGIHRTDYKGVAWYRRTFSVPADFPKNERVWLHFGAVDWRADVWVNGHHVAEHEGGYTPFSADITDALKPGEPALVVVRAFDPTDPHYPTGKQVGWYTPTSGIWQTVWLESRPKAHIAGFSVRTSIDPAEAIFEISMAGLEASQYAQTIRSADPTIEKPQAMEADGGTSSAKFKLKVNQPKLWTPEDPHLYDVTIELKGPDGSLDSVRTYFGLRTIARGKYGDAPFERILLNGKPIYIRGALDQSFNPKGIYTAPDDDFLKNDIALAKSLGLNALRIHIKPDEPRRLYWADKLGLLIMQDMPNTWVQDATARKAWEQTMREAVPRDRNHPSVFAWVAFNETWGLGKPDEYKASKDTQEWVRTMVAAIRQLDPTRLIEDNSPCNYDHVDSTDLNSWHFYIDDSEKSRQHIAEVVEKTAPGSGYNYCPGLAQASAPLINSEYGAVSAGGGDRDVSWGFRDLTTQLRKHPKIQGYIYTELSDIEWEHNGFVNYDRTPKEFGYAEFVPGMTVADLQGADFVGFDAPAVIVAKPGETIRVPLFVSHYSERPDKPRVKWNVAGVDGFGERVEIVGPDRLVDWTPYGVTAVKPAGFKITPGPFVGALAISLEDSTSQRIAANFVNIVVQRDRPEPRVERRGNNEVAVRFRPEELAQSEWSGPSGTRPSKAFGQGQGSFVYRLKLPPAVVKAKPTSFLLLLEVSSKAGRERVDWPQRKNKLDNPQTDARTWPSTLEVTINGESVARFDVADDPADARGVLSHVARVDHGSFGGLVRVKADLPRSAQADLAAGKPLELRLSVPADAPNAGGLCLFGAELGAFPFDPTLLFETADALPSNLGVSPDAPVTIDVGVKAQKEE
jgi:hypothetical protein